MEANCKQHLNAESMSSCLTLETIRQYIHQGNSLTYLHYLLQQLDSHLLYQKYIQLALQLFLTDPTLTHTQCLPFSILQKYIWSPHSVSVLQQLLRYLNTQLTQQQYIKVMYKLFSTHLISIPKMLQYLIFQIVQNYISQHKSLQHMQSIVQILNYYLIDQQYIKVVFQLILNNSFQINKQQFGQFIQFAQTNQLSTQQYVTIYKILQKYPQLSNNHQYNIYEQQQISIQQSLIIITNTLFQLNYNQNKQIRNQITIFILNNFVKKQFTSKQQMKLFLAIFQQQSFYQQINLQTIKYLILPFMKVVTNIYHQYVESIKILKHILAKQEIYSVTQQILQAYQYCFKSLKISHESILQISLLIIQNCLKADSISQIDSLINKICLSYKKQQYCSKIYLKLTSQNLQKLKIHEDNYQSILFLLNQKQEIISQSQPLHQQNNNIVKQNQQKLLPQVQSLLKLISHQSLTQYNYLPLAQNIWQKIGNNFTIKQQFMKYLFNTITNKQKKWYQFVKAYDNYGFILNMFNQSYCQILYQDKSYLSNQIKIQLIKVFMKEIANNSIQKCQLLTKAIIYLVSQRKILKELYILLKNNPNKSYIKSVFRQEWKLFPILIKQLQIV